MAVYYPEDNCQSGVPEHLCDPCKPIELGGVRSVGFIDADATFANPSDPVEWAAKLLAGTIKLIPETSGTFDGGTPQEGAGFGDSPTSLDGYDYSLEFFDPNFVGNCDFYDNMKNARNAFKVIWRTETQVYLSDRSVIVLPKFPIANDVKSRVLWQVIVKWSSKNLPCSYTSPGAATFRCIQNL